MDTTIAQQVKEGISSGLSDVSDLWALAGYSNPFSAGVAIVTSIDSIATIGVNLSSNSEIVSQITTIRYANFLITENKETLIERYNTLYSFVEKCVDSGLLTYNVDLCGSVYEDSIYIADDYAFEELIDDMDNEFIKNVEMGLGGYANDIVIHTPDNITDSNSSRDSIVSLEPIILRPGSVVTIEPEGTNYERTAVDLSK